jgi:hypothetical protein
VTLKGARGAAYIGRQAPQQELWSIPAIETAWGNVTLRVPRIYISGHVASIEVNAIYK